MLIVAQTRWGLTLEISGREESTSSIHHDVNAAACPRTRIARVTKGVSGLHVWRIAGNWKTMMRDENWALGESKLLFLIVDSAFQQKREFAVKGQQSLLYGCTRQLIQIMAFLYLSVCSCISDFLQASRYLFHLADCLSDKTELFKSTNKQFFLSILEISSFLSCRFQ